MGAKRKKAPASVLQEVFLKRLREELERQGLSGNALSRRAGAPAQMTINDVMNGADPRLKTVDQIARALGIPAWHLLTETVGNKRQDGTVHKFPELYPPIFGRRSTDHVSKSPKKARKV
jgi:transcriptional regulator with XRE-family HTH domain